MAEAETKQRLAQVNGPLDFHEDNGEYEIDLVELLYKLLDNLKYIIASAIVCAVIAAVYTIGFVTPLYQATSKIYVVNSKDSAINLSDLQIGSYLTSDYQEVFKTWEVHEGVISKLGLGYTYLNLQKMLTITNPASTRILNITVTSADPQEAADIANAYASVSSDYIAEKMATDKPNVLSMALKPTLPVSPNKTQNIMLGFILGAFIVIGFVVIRFITDDKLKTAEDIRKYTGLATLAMIHVVADNSTVPAQKIKKMGARK